MLLLMNSIVLSVGGVELLQDGYDDGAIGDGAHKDGNPVGRVLADEGNAVSRLHAAVLEQQVQLCDIAGKVAIGQALFGIIVSQCRQFPIVDETALINFDQVFLHHSGYRFITRKGNEIIPNPLIKK